jgi:hypothetical protein
MNTEKGEKNKYINHIKEYRIYTFRPIDVRDLMKDDTKMTQINKQINTIIHISGLAKKKKQGKLFVLDPVLMLLGNCTDNYSYTANNSCCLYCASDD